MGVAAESLLRTIALGPLHRRLGEEVTPCGLGVS